MNEQGDDRAESDGGSAQGGAALDWRAVVAAIPEGVVVQDATGSIIEANEAACAILGLTYEQITGRDSLDPRWSAQREDGSPFPGDEHPAMVTLRTGRPVDGVVMGVSIPDGARRWIRVASRLIVDHAGVPHVLALFVDITAEQTRLQALADREELYRVLTETTADGVAIVSPGGSVRYTSPSFTALLGVTAGGDAWEDLARVIHPDDHAEAVRALTGLRRDGAHGRQFEVRVRDVHAVWRWAEVRIWLPQANDGTIVVVRDVTARKMMERELADAEELFRQTFDEAPVGLAMATVSADDPVVVRANRLFGDALGFEPAELVGRSTRSFTHPEDHAASVAARQRLASGDSSYERTAVRLLRSDDSVAWYSVSRSVLRDQAGAPRFILAQIEDATETQGLISHLSALAHSDPLTGLTNRRGLEIELEELLADPLGASRAALCFLDLDGFKDVNDSFGHPVGDEVLKDVAHRLRSMTRSHDTVARVGGDEFVILARHVGVGDGADGLVGRFSTTLAQVGTAPVIEVRCSVGLARPRPDDTADRLLARADRAMYEAKHQRRAADGGG